MELRGVRDQILRFSSINSENLSSEPNVRSVSDTAICSDLPGTRFQELGTALHPFTEHQPDRYVRKKEQYGYRRLGHEHSGVMNEVKLLSGY